MLNDFRKSLRPENAAEISEDSIPDASDPTEDVLCSGLSENIENKDEMFEGEGGKGV